MEAHLSAAWDADALRVVECRCCQQQHGEAVDGSGVSTSKRLRLSQHGLEFSVVTRERTLTAKQRVEVIPWTDILGAAELDSGQQAHILSSREFVVYGCLPKARALEWTNRGDDDGILSSWGVRGLLDTLSCWRNDDDGDATDSKDVVTAADTLPAFNAADASNTKSSTKGEGPVQRVLMQWALRYTGKDADTYVARVVRAIQSLADPRITRLRTPGDHEPQQLPRRVSTYMHGSVDESTGYRR